MLFLLKDNETTLSPNLGVAWPWDQLPVNMYEYRVDSGPFSPMSDIDDGDDFALCEILRWVYHTRVLMTSDNHVTWNEELRYIVKSHEVYMDDTAKAIKWHALVQVFDIRDQAIKTLEFRVAGN